MNKESGLADKHISKAYEMYKKYNEKGSKLLKGKLPKDAKKLESLYKTIRGAFDKADAYHKKGNRLFDTQWKSVLRASIKEGKKPMVKKAGSHYKEVTRIPESY